MCDLTQIRQSFIEKDGHYWLTAEDLGSRLGYAEPRKAVNQVHQRNQEEIEPFTGVVKLKTPGGRMNVTVYDEQGCYIIAMLAKTDQAVQFRRQVSKLLQNMREKVEQVSNLTQDYTRLRMEYAELRLKKFLQLSKIFDRKKVERLAQIASLGILTFDEIGRVFECSESHARRVWKMWRESKGDFEDVNLLTGDVK